MADKRLSCAIISGAPDFNVNIFKSHLTDFDYLICADIGYNYARKLGVVPDLIIGDFDSYFGKLPETEIITLNAHKDDTDTLHCCKEAILRGYKDITIFGGIGGRFDHSFANLCALQYLKENGAKGKIITNYETIQYETVGEYVFTNVKNKTFSVFPFACNEANVSYIGSCEYPANKLNLNSCLAMGVSNVFLEDCVKIKVNTGCVLIILQNNSNLE